jgi:hypothetical protein
MKLIKMLKMMIKLSKNKKFNIKTEKIKKMFRFLNMKMMKMRFTMKKMIIKRKFLNI